MAVLGSLKQCTTSTFRGSLLNAAKGHRSMATTAGSLHEHQPRRAGGSGMMMVFGILGGMICFAGSIGLHTAKQQLMHSPSVQVTKKKRQSIPEVDNPDAVLGSADKFANKSFLRKVAHIQENKNAHNDPQRPDPFTRSREIETLKSVGVRT
ncbi:hypothetical protein ACJIZ3_004659 [Penstemon smallii]|uniref:Transmembrane protein n=1 Tax=Penstemon smallii TaxID=265156 RepID=A0ABD3S2N1_9LAMI